MSYTPTYYFVPFVFLQQYILCRDANCSDFIGSFPIFAYPFRYYDYIELSSDFLGDLIIICLVHFISRLLVERDDFLESI